MLTYQSGNLLDSQCQALVNTVNTQGVMGKGLALEFKKRYPNMYEEYKYACELERSLHKGVIAPGKIWEWGIDFHDQSDKVIINVFTKDSWRDPSQYIWVWEGLANIAKCVSEHHIKSIALPPLGCGNGKLDQNKVTKMIELFHKIFWQHIEVEYYSGPKKI